MNFIDFLIKYYVWIIVVLVILIITIIGFLADKKMKNKKDKNKENDEKMMNNEINEPTSLQPQNILNGNDIPVQQPYNNEVVNDMNVGRDNNFAQNNYATNSNGFVANSNAQALNSLQGITTESRNESQADKWEVPTSPEPTVQPSPVMPEAVAPTVNAAPINAWEVPTSPEPTVQPSPVMPEQIAPTVNAAPVANNSTAQYTTSVGQGQFFDVNGFSNNNINNN